MLFSFLDRWSARQVSRSRPRRPANRPGLEVLEDRLAPATFTVLNADNAGDGSLRQAILKANANPGPDTIDFNIPGVGVKTINLQSALPAVTGPTTIDGTTQGGVLVGPPIELNGTGAGASANGLVVTGGGSLIRGLTINHFGANGILLQASGCVVAGCFLGTDSGGSAAAANQAHGVLITGVAVSNRIGGSTVADRNVIAGNVGAGVFIAGGAAKNNLVLGNRIGVDFTGTAAVGNGLAGVLVSMGARSNVIGGSAAGAGNLISGNGQLGVSLLGAGTMGNVVQGNIIGLRGDGAVAAGLGNGVGVSVAAGAAFNIIGGAAGNTISGNLEAGVALTGAGTKSNTLSNNRIGTDPTGTDARPNFLGVVIKAGANLVQNNVISASGGAGVLIAGVGVNGNVVRGNRIGLDGPGPGNLGNSPGVEISNGARYNVVGGSSVPARNVISGNSHGVVLSGAGTSNNLVLGNFIGTDAAGTAAIPNGIGVRIANGATNNTVGGPGAARNVISGNATGVVLSGAGTSFNAVRGNYIGTNAAGSGALGNVDGVKIVGGATNNTVGGSGVLARNVISGNALSGVVIEDNGTSFNAVQGNFIGTNPAGTGGIANGIGVRIAGAAAYNLVGGSVLARNVISGNTNRGVHLTGNGTSNNLVQGNYIGVNATSTAPLANNNGVGIDAGATNNTVGGQGAARNVISGNTNHGVSISGAGTSHNAVRGNFIGLNATGTAAMANAFGVAIDAGATDNTVGGSSAAARNVISGNASCGVSISGAGTSHNAVQGNFIGTRAAGTAALSNFIGVQIFGGATGNTVGGSSAARNVVSGNYTGVSIYGDGTSGNVVQGNFIGVGAAGTVALGNTYGLAIEFGAMNNTVGGSTTAARNVISGNAFGVYIAGNGTSGNAVQGNFIGLAADGAPRGNAGPGVFITKDASGNSIGGAVAGAGNVIAYNGGGGVLIGSDGFVPLAGSGNSAQGNYIFKNGGEGIDLGPNDGITPNDANDADAGPNDLLNHPELQGATLQNGVLFLTGSINTQMNKTLRVEVFASPAADPSGHGEGQTYLGFFMVQTGASNTVGFTKALQAPGVKPGQVITLTATDELGNTSEFSLAVKVL